MYNEKVSKVFILPYCFPRLEDYIIAETPMQGAATRGIE